MSRIIPGIPEFVRGEPVSLEEMARLAEVVRRAGMVDGLGGPPLTGSLQNVNPWARIGTWARLTAKSAGPRPTYSWVESVDAGQGFFDRPDGLTGSLNAREFNGADIDLSQGPVNVWLWLTDGSDEAGVIWAFAHCCTSSKPVLPVVSGYYGSGSILQSDVAGGGACALARLIPSDCMLATFSYDEEPVRLQGDGQTWTAVSPVGYPSGGGLIATGALVFGWDVGQGQIYSSLAGKRLMNCGNGCFTGGPLTGHVTYPSGASLSCAGEVFTICFECTPCPPPTPDGGGSLVIPCSGLPLGPFDAVMSNHTGDCATTSICPGPPSSLTNIGSTPSGPWSGVTFRVDCAGAFYVIYACEDGNFSVRASSTNVSGTGVLGTIISYSASPLMLVADFSTTSGAFCQGTGATNTAGFRVTITGP